MKVRLTDEALEDLEAVGDYIARDDPERADSFVAELIEAARDLAQFPSRFPVVDRYARLGIRHRTYRCYLIFYRVDASGVLVLRILHASRDHAALLSGGG